ncbi:hypothetical protein [Campylobacter phage vB_Cj_QDYZ]|uniref:Uncharacterized protein n=1 Tax=Campylobacter phage vB_Cj_QDYZ TaxID=3032374 RepID=A0AAF0GCI0_9CAUD|nr:hypothetical protein [Campylobacter phage vB_Cj_QDYZ]
MNKQLGIYTIICYCVLSIIISFINLPVAFEVFDRVGVHFENPKEYITMLFETYTDMLTWSFIIICCMLLLVTNKYTTKLYNIVVSLSVVYIMYDFISNCIELYSLYNLIYVEQFFDVNE